MLKNIMNFFKKANKKETANHSKEAAKERLHLVLMQDRANVSVDFLDLMRQEIIEVIKKYIDIDEGAMDVRLTNKENEDGTQGAPALYANIPIVNIKEETRKLTEKNKTNAKVAETKAKSEDKPVKEEGNEEEEKEEKQEEKKETAKSKPKQKKSKPKSKPQKEEKEKVKESKEENEQEEIKSEEESKDE